MNILSEKWYGKSISERIQWYKDKLDSLYDELVLKDSFSEEILGHAAASLQIIKYHMRKDLKAATVAGLNNIQIEYLDAIGSAYLELETIDNNFLNWYKALGRAADFIIFLKRK